MAGASDKARFYLEQYVPELQEFQRKGIFTPAEITSIAAKRNDFEHVLNARGSKPVDYARYATYEMNLEKLRKKRSQRLGIKTTTFSGQRTIFFILDRATKKFPGDMGLWMQYIHFCQQEKANKKLAKVFTKVLRLKPRDWGLWVLAAKHYAEKQGDMSTARSYMQRGLRFCKDDVELWLEYMRLEMVYLAKLAARRKILGFDKERQKEESVHQDGQEEGDVIALPTFTAEDMEPDSHVSFDDSNADALQKLASTPAYTGGIPIAIFDAAMKRFGAKTEVAEKFFEIVAAFDQVPASRRILQHIVNVMQATSHNSAEAIICEIKVSLFGVKQVDADFPLVLGKALTRVNAELGSSQPASHLTLVEKMLSVLDPYLQREDELDEDVVKVLRASAKRYSRLLDSRHTMELDGTARD